MMRHTHFPAAVLAAGLLFCTLFSGQTAYAEGKKDELTQKQTETRQEYEAAQSTLRDLQSAQTQTENEVAALSGQAAELTGQIAAVTQAVQDAQTALDERQAAADTARAALDAKQAEYNARLAACKEQLRAMQRLDGGGGIWLLSQAKSLYQLLTFDTVLRQMNAKNSAVLAELDAEAAALEQARAEADTAVQQAAEAKAALESQQAALSATQSELEAALLAANSALTQQQAAAQAQAAVTDAAKKAYEDATAALDAYVREQSRRYTTADLHLTSLAFRCPLDSYGRITTQFAEPDPWGIPHRGTDFAAPGGTPIYAVANGVVSAARTMNSYGNCVQVSHGTADDGHRYDSLYAHMSSITVAEGTAVQKGDLLGYVGNTGNVYGAGGGYHLHLELRVDGARVNPLGYVPSR
ncbi:MAG: peptidoglycan DD-metalloendopeptidase family protein [Oscillospiraceae bacterium]|nr:peptidoglycan DD-metalloendopeptidase family protein [Oscillospiraceae bacterium]